MDGKQKRRRSIRNLRRQSGLEPINFDIDTVGNEEKLETGAPNRDDGYGSLWMETQEPVNRKKKRRSSLFVTALSQTQSLEPQSQLDDLADFQLKHVPASKAQEDDLTDFQSRHIPASQIQVDDLTDLQSKHISEYQAQLQVDNIDHYKWIDIPVSQTQKGDMEDSISKQVPVSEAQVDDKDFNSTQITFPKLLSSDMSSCKKLSEGNYSSVSKQAISFKILQTVNEVVLDDVPPVVDCRKPSDASNQSESLLTTNVTPPNIVDDMSTPLSMSPEYPESPLEHLYQNSHEESYIVSTVNSNQSTSLKSDLSSNDSVLSNKENNINNTCAGFDDDEGGLQSSKIETTISGSEKGGKSDDTSPGFLSISKAIGKVVNFVKTSPSYILGIGSDSNKAELSASPVLKVSTKDNVLPSTNQDSTSVTALVSSTDKDQITVTKLKSPGSQKNEIFFNTYNAIMKVFQNTNTSTETDVSSKAANVETNLNNQHNNQDNNEPNLQNDRDKTGVEPGNFEMSVIKNDSDDIIKDVNLPSTETECGTGNDMNELVSKNGDNFEVNFKGNSDVTQLDCENALNSSSDRDLIRKHADDAVGVKSTERSAIDNFLPEDVRNVNCEESDKNSMEIEESLTRQESTNNDQDRDMRLENNIVSDTSETNINLNDIDKNNGDASLHTNDILITEGCSENGDGVQKQSLSRKDNVKKYKRRCIELVPVKQQSEVDDETEKKQWELNVDPDSIINENFQKNGAKNHKSRHQEVENVVKKYKRRSKEIVPMKPQNFSQAGLSEQEYSGGLESVKSIDKEPTYTDIDIEMVLKKYSKRRRSAEPSAEPASSKNKQKSYKEDFNRELMEKSECGDLPSNPRKDLSKGFCKNDNLSDKSVLQNPLFEETDNKNCTIDVDADPNSTNADVTESVTKKRRSRRSADMTVLASHFEFETNKNSPSGTLCDDTELLTEQSSNSVSKSGKRRGRRSRDSQTLKADLQAFRDNSNEENLDKDQMENFDGNSKTEPDDSFTENKSAKNAPRNSRKSKAAALTKMQVEIEMDDLEEDTKIAKVSRKRKPITDSDDEVELIYRNKKYVKPEEHKPWVTIFESPDKFGETMGKRRMQRYIDFERPTQMKLRRRLQKAKKNGLKTSVKKKMTLNDDQFQQKINMIWSDLDSSNPESPSLQDELRKFVETE